MTCSSAGASAPGLRVPLRCSILIDFDGTVTLADSTDCLLERFGSAGWEELETAWRDGRIGSRECMCGQVGLLDMSREELDEFVAGIEIDPALPEFVEAAARQGCNLLVGSDGLDHVIRSVLSRNGLGHLPFQANRLVQVAARRWRLETPFSRDTCTSSSATCKCALIEAAHSRGARSVLIGDGASDRCVAAKVDLVLAKPGLVAHCAINAIPYLAIAGFSDALRLLPDVINDPHDRVSCT
jgi:2-hydroxy-3-keto-5-methylthiopentenyl-1-phosphate phosphatase